jgi:hypothetical protein
MSDANYNLTDAKVLTELEGLNGGVGGYAEKLTDVGSGSTTSATFVDITGVANQTFTTPISGEHIIFLDAIAYGTSAACGVEFAVVIDDGTAQLIGEYWFSAPENLGAYQHIVGFIKVDLTAGEHTIRTQWRRPSGSGTVNIDSFQSNITLLIQGQGAGINGLEVLESTLASNHTVTAVYSTWEQAASVECVVNTLENEQVMLTYNGRMYVSASVNGYVGYSVDGGTPITTQSVISLSAAAKDDAVAFSVLTDPLTAGQHTIRLMVSKQNSSTVTFYGASSGTQSCTFQATRFKSAGIGAGTIVTTDTIASDKTITSVNPTHEDTGFEVTFTTIADETVLLSFSGTAAVQSATDSSIYLAYKLDSDSDVKIFSQAGQSTEINYPSNVSFQIPITIATAGQHTIKLRAARDAADWKLFKDSNHQSLLSITQFRGGLIPILDDTVEIVEKPSALDFTGAGVVVTTSGTNAIITIAADPQDIADLTTLSGVAGNNTDLGTFTGSTIPDTQTIKQALQALETEVELKETTTIVSEIDTNVDDLITLSGVAENASDLGTFTGATIADTSTIKAALQAMETAYETTDGLIDTHIDGGVNKHDASEVDVEGTYANISGTPTDLESTISALNDKFNVSSGFGGYQAILFEKNPTVVYGNSGTSYATLDGTTQQTFTTPVTGSHMFTLEGSGYRNSATLKVWFRLVIDKGTGDEVIVGDSDLWIRYSSSGDGHEGFSFSGVANLASGEHTLDIEVKVDTDTWRWNTVDTLVCAVQALGSGITGLDTQSYELSSSFSVTQAFIDQPGGNMAQVDSSEITINTLENEAVEVSFVGSLYASSGTSDVILGYQIDSDTPIVQLYEVETSTSVGAITFSTMTAPLSAGQHTIKLMASKTVGAPQIYVSNSGGSARFTVTRFKSIGIGAGTIITEDTLVGDYATTSSWADTGLSVTINVIEGEDVQLTFGGSAQPSNTSTTNSILVGYRVDSGSDVPMTAVGNETSIRVQNLSFSTTISGLSAGSHTIALRAKHDSTRSWNLNETSDDYSGAKLSAIQHRGGLIPVKDEGTEIVEKPSALNFVGALVEADGTEAKVTFPNAALGGYMEELTFAGTGATTSASFEDVTSMSNQTFTTPVSGPHLIQMEVYAYVGTSASTNTEVAFVIDDGTAQSAGIVAMTPVGEWHSGTVSLVVTLAAGEHTIRPQWKRESGSGTVNSVVGVPWKMFIHSNGAGINGLEVEETVLASDHTITTTFVAEEGGGMADVTGLSATVNTVEGEKVQVTFEGSWLVPDATDNGIVYGYQVDSDTPVVVGYDLNRESTAVALVGFTLMTAALSAGSHTIKIKASRISGSTSPKILAKGGSYGFYVNSKMQVTRFTSQEREIVVAKYTNGAGTTITNNLLTILDFPTKEIDTHDAVTTGAGWVFTAPTAGYYRISSNVVMDLASWGEAGFTWLVVYKNGAEHTALDLNVKGTTGSTNTGAGGTTIIECTEGDTLQVRIYHNGGTDTDLVNIANRNTVSINLIGGTLPAEANAWESFTPTGGWSTNTTYAGHYRITGDTMEVTCKVSLSGAPTAANLTINLPSGWAIDTNKIEADSVFTPLGDCLVRDTTPGSSYVGMVVYSSTTAVRALIQQSSGSYTSLGTVNSTTPVTFASGDFIHLRYKFPVIAT